MIESIFYSYFALFLQNHFIFVKSRNLYIIDSLTLHRLPYLSQSILPVTFNIFSSRKLSIFPLVPPTMIWSSNSIPNSCPHFCSFLVTIISSFDGFTLPLGWLWSPMIAEAFARILLLKTSLGITKDALIVPTLTRFILIIYPLFFIFRIQSIRI